MKKILFLLMLSFLFVYPAQAQNRILIVGDSLSAGYGIHIQDSWPSLLQKKLRQENIAYQVINASISGNTTDNGLANLPTLLKEHHPSIIILELGANDGLRGADPQNIRKNLQEMVTLSKTYGKVLLVSVHLPPNYGEIYNQRFEAVFKELAEHNHIPLVTLHLRQEDNRAQLIQQDGLHPTALAQPLILEEVWEGLQATLQILRKP